MARATLLDATQFTTTPTGTYIPILDGQIDLAGAAKVNATGTLTTTADLWESVKPYGNYVFLERGIEFAPGDAEYVPLGYFRIEQVDQVDCPNGPIRLTLLDRTAQLQQNIVTFPVWLDAGMTHSAIFELLVNGGTYNSQTTYAALPGSTIPIVWTHYDGATKTLENDVLVTESSYDFLAGLVAPEGARLRFDRQGRLEIASSTAAGPTPVARLVGGKSGTVRSFSRTITRREVYNIITAYGSDPTSPTDFVITFNESGPLEWDKTTYPKFGPAPRYADSPLWGETATVSAAADVLINEYSALPEHYTLSMVPNPALEPLDVVSLCWGPNESDVTVVIDTMSLPLTAAGISSLTTRGLTTAEAT